MSEVVTEREREILRCALGLSRGKEMYRNHFAADGEGDDYNDCRKLENKGLMKESGTSDRLVFFHVTDAGKALVQTPPPAPGLTKYQCWTDELELCLSEARNVCYSSVYLAADVEALLDDLADLTAQLVRKDKP